MMTISTKHAFALAAVLATAACDKGPDPAADGPAEEEAAAPSDEASDEATAEASAEVPGEAQRAQRQQQAPPQAADGTYEPGPIGVRVVNTLGDPVDVYVRTTGRVQAFEVAEDVASGEVSDWAFPPAGGNLLVTTAGSDDPTCFSGCDHFIVQVRPEEAQGSAQTVVLHMRRDAPSGTTFWENPTEEQQGRASNAMATATADQGTFVVNSSGLSDARFGLYLGYSGVEGCQTPSTTTNQLVGGTGTPGFTFEPGSVDVLLYDNQDRDCSGDPVGGPFSIDVAAGERSHLILHGSPGDMSAVVIPMAGPEGPAN